MLAGLSKFAKLARSVTRSRSVLVSQFSSHLPNLKDTTKQSHLAHVRSTLDLAPVSPYTYLYRAAWACLLVFPNNMAARFSSLSLYLSRCCELRYLILQSQTYNYSIQNKLEVTLHCLCRTQLNGTNIRHIKVFFSIKSINLELLFLK